jgi:hypothetical protein
MGTKENHLMHWIDPQSLPSVENSVSRFLFNADGNADGFLFADGQQVHFPPHLSRQLLKRVKVGDTVRVRGVKPRGADVLVAFALTTRGGHTIEDRGPQDEPHHAAPKLKTKPAEHAGTVERTLFAPKGEPCGAILNDGTLVRVLPKGNEALVPYLQVGKAITVWGLQFVVRGTRVIDVSHLAYTQ